MKQKLEASLIILFTFFTSVVFAQAEMKEAVTDQLNKANVVTVSAGIARQSIKGIVTTSDGRPAEQVSIYLKEINKGTVSLEDGSYRISNVPVGEHTIIVSFSGLETIEKKLLVSENEPLVSNFVLKENAKELREIVIAYFRSVNDRATVFGKSAIKPMDLPQAIATVSEVVIKDQQAQRLSDVIKNVNCVSQHNKSKHTGKFFCKRVWLFFNQYVS
jgi:iron complex outermembrane receptor protein